MALDLPMEPDESTPLYQQLAKNLRGKIEDGTLQEGHSLPSERALTAITGMSRITVRKGIDELIREGLLFRKQGSGTYVAKRIETRISGLKSFSEEARARGENASVIWMFRTYASPTNEEAEVLGIGPGESVARLGRVRLIGKEPLAIEHAVVPAEFLPDLNALEDGLYVALTRAGRSPTSGTQTIRASLATSTEAAILSVAENSEILRIKRVTKSIDGRHLEFTRSAYRGDRYDLVSELSVGDRPGD